MAYIFRCNYIVTVWNFGREVHARTIIYDEIRGFFPIP